MRLLVTRPKGDAPDTVRALEDRGHTVLLEPLLHIEQMRDAAIPRNEYQAVLVTSANGVRALACVDGAQTLKGTLVLAVGEASGRAATAAGFRTVRNAAGDLDALSALVSEQCDPDGGALLYAAGSVVSGDLKGLLGARGYEIDRVVLYTAKPVETISHEIEVRLRDGMIDGVLLYSPRSARIWGQVTGRSGLAENVRSMVYFCLSRAVADALVTETGWEGAQVTIAPEPNEKSLLEVI